MKLSPTKFLDLLNQGYSFDYILLLVMMKEGWEIPESDKVSLLLSTLKRKLLITEEGKITAIGESILEHLNSKEGKKIKKKVESNSDFDVWWATYPSTDTFEYKGKRFEGSRSLKASKDECQRKYNKILLEGELSSNDLLEALKFEIEQKKSMSFKTGINKLSFMQNSATYLNQRTFDSYIELLKTKQEEINTFNGVDI